MFYLWILPCYISYSLVHLFRSLFFVFSCVLPPLSFGLAGLSLSFSYFHMYPPAALIFSSHFSFHICFSSLHLSLLSRAASSPLFSSSTIISSSSCTCSIAHCRGLNCVRKKTDYLLSCKITTRLFPVCWPGLYLGDKQHCLLVFSLPRTPFTLSWLLLTEWIINHFLPFLLRR